MDGEELGLPTLLVSRRLPQLPNDETVKGKETCQGEAEEKMEWLPENRTLEMDGEELVWNNPIFSRRLPKEPSDEKVTRAGKYGTTPPCTSKSGRFSLRKKDAEKMISKKEDAEGIEGRLPKEPNDGTVARTGRDGTTSPCTSQPCRFSQRKRDAGKMISKKEDAEGIEE